MVEDMRGERWDSRKPCKRGCSSFDQRGLSLGKKSGLDRGAAVERGSMAGESLACLKVSVAWVEGRLGGRNGGR